MLAQNTLFLIGVDALIGDGKWSNTRGSLGGMKDKNFLNYIFGIVDRYISYDSTITGGCFRGRGANVLISVRLLSINSQCLITVHRIKPAMFTILGSFE